MKLSIENVNKMIECCTKKEIDFLIYIGQFQDENGIIEGVDYKDVLVNIEICKASFYKILYSLESKGLIQINYLNGVYGFWEIQILNNVFATKDDYKKGYIKLHYTVLHSVKFKQMTKGEKVVILHLFKLYDLRNVGIKITLKRIMEWTGKSLRSVKKFIETLKKSNMFDIAEWGKMIVVSIYMGFGIRTAREVDIKNNHTVGYKLRKTKTKAIERDVVDVLTLFRNYASKVGKDLIIKAIDRSIEVFGTLQPAYINRLINIGVA